MSAPDTNGLSIRSAEMIARRDRLLGPAYRLFYAEPVHIVRGEGVWLYDDTGKAYLDVYNNVASVGHCHPHVVSALARQASVLNTHTRYLSEPVLDYAERLLSTLPDALSHIMFTCSGSEANDLALRIARDATGAHGVIISRLAYHGGTESVAAISPSLGSGVPLGQAVRTVSAPDPYRDSADVAASFTSGVEAAIADLVRHGIRPAALIVDTLFASDGVFADPPGLLQGAVVAIRKAGGLFIADEVQAGFGRTGDQFWGFARHGIVPDLVTIGKPMGAGHPMAATIVRPSVVAEFGARSRYFNTFGGNPVSAAVGLAVLETIEVEQLMANAAVVGHQLRGGLRELSMRHEAIGDVRGAGLFVGCELVSDRGKRLPDPALTTRVINDLRHRGVLIGTCGARGNVLKIRPPLVFRAEHCAMFLNALDRSLGSVG